MLRWLIQAKQLKAMCQPDGQLTGARHRLPVSLLCVASELSLHGKTDRVTFRIPPPDPANQAPPSPISLAERSKNEQIHKGSLETDAKTLAHARTPKQNQASLLFVKRAAHGAPARPAAMP